MLSAVNRRLLAWAQRHTPAVTCTECGQSFAPFHDQDLESWIDFAAPSNCPHCGSVYRFTSSSEAQRRERAVTQATAQPTGSRIEKRVVSARELLFHIPASGRSGGIGCFAIIWNGFLLVFIPAMFFGQWNGTSGAPWPVWLFMIPFVAVGIGFAYAALRAKYARHLLFLGPELIRLQRQLFNRARNYDLPTPEVERAEEKEFYQQNYQPVFGIEIAAGARKIRFGSILTAEEKAWLVREIRDFLAAEGNAYFIEAELAAEAEPAEIEPLSEPDACATALPAVSNFMREQTARDEVSYRIPPAGGAGAFITVGLFLSGLSGFLLFNILRDLLPDIAGPGFDLFAAFSSVILLGGLLIVTPVFLLGVLILAASIRLRFAHHRLTLGRDEVVLTSSFLTRDTRALPTRGITSVELVEFAQLNTRKLRTIRLRAGRRSLRFGHGLSDADQHWLVADIRPFLSSSQAG